MAKVTIACKFCGKELIRTQRDVDRNRHLFCSLSCRSKARAVSPEERFKRFVGPQLDNGCIPWLGGKTPQGYGKFYPPGYAHRMAYILANGPIPDSLNVLHRCDNPCCINPDHMFLGTIADNNADRVAKGRTPQGDSSSGRKLTSQDVVVIRARYDNGEPVAAISKDYPSVILNTIWLIATRRTWKCVEQDG